MRNRVKWIIWDGDKFIPTLSLFILVTSKSFWMSSSFYQKHSQVIGLVNYNSVWISSYNPYNLCLFITVSENSHAIVINLFWKFHILDKICQSRSNQVALRNGSFAMHLTMSRTHFYQRFEFIFSAAITQKWQSGNMLSLTSLSLFFRV